MTPAAEGLMNTLPASIPSPDPAWASFPLGPFTVHVYALCIIAGILVAAFITDRRLRKRGVPPWTVIDIVI